MTALIFTCAIALIMCFGSFVIILATYTDVLNVCAEILKSGINNTIANTIAIIYFIVYNLTKACKSITFDSIRIISPSAACIVVCVIINKIS